MEWRPAGRSWWKPARRWRATEQLRDLEQRWRRISQLLAGLRADWEDLRRQSRDVVAAVQALGVLQTQLVEAMAQLQAGQEALRRDHDTSQSLLRGLRERGDRLLDERRSLIASIESIVDRLKHGESA